MSTVRARELAVEGAFEFTPRAFPDHRGFFVSPFQESALVAAAGFPLFPVRQLSYSLSRRGVIRGVHYTATPPGMAKYVHCARGRVLDLVVDVRVGSPTYGRFDTVLLDQRDFRSVYFPVGVGHMFVALEDDSIMSYALAGEYAPRHERAVSPFDPRLGLPIPDDIVPVLSDRDRHAPTLEEAEANGELPLYARCRELEAEFARTLTPSP
ncbi:dTDP-4-dehydrorhamnose 3,5-epimerase [Microtetraspora sp. NBRC 13810]|uniref:dTDP-4-dehydrorhamnose 3,5-epimerase family protein n=1 Tax=Microtetraspora sp. NBRC 13810 TaxID=3030990 RepID=UPI0024A4CBF3|nr:dTDP-4-dehydrorhamnose 3,5-epimerase family protein [Microtetraspora sp. NBRC 13810]GLW09411.1 dTDP-4-dehydrorhamnose 3,5-epimerase [Microtetraspora sp. NBRC 13810]